MIRTTNDLESELYRLRGEVAALSRIVDNAIFDSVDVLQRRVSPIAHSDAHDAEPLITLDHQLTKRRFAVEMDCLALIASHQPVDGDLRAITSLLEIVSELEYIGRYVTDIARVHFMLARVVEPVVDLVNDLHIMSIRVREMLQQATFALEQADDDSARAAFHKDQEVDDLYRQFFRKMMTLMRGRSRTTMKQARYLSQIARNLERTADRVTNICEWVVFFVTGEFNTIGQEPAALAKQEMIG
jgi:phosphate transport system protein